MEALKAKMQQQLNAIKQQHKEEYESAVDSERTERLSERQSTDRTTVTTKTEKSFGLTPSPSRIQQVSIDEEGTWDEFSFGTTPDTSERYDPDSIDSFRPNHLSKFHQLKKTNCPAPKAPKLAQISSNIQNKVNKKNGNDKEDNDFGRELQSKSFKKVQRENMAQADSKRKFRQTAEFKNFKKDFGPTTMEEFYQSEVDSLQLSERQRHTLDKKKELLKKRFREHKMRTSKAENQGKKDNNQATERSELTLSRSQSPKKPHYQVYENSIDYLNTSTDRRSRLAKQNSQKKRTVFGEVRINNHSKQEANSAEEYEFNSNSTVEADKQKIHEQINNHAANHFTSFNHLKDKENFNLDTNIQFNTNASSIYSNKNSDNFQYMSVQTAKTNKSRAKLRELAQQNSKRSSSKGSLMSSKMSNFHSNSYLGSSLEGPSSMNHQKRELMVMSKKLGKLNQDRAASFAKLSSKYEQLLSQYKPYSEDEESKLGEEMVQELGNIASIAISKKQSKFIHSLNS